MIEDDKLAEELKKEFEKAMEKFGEQHNIDWAYFGIKISLTFYDDEFEKYSEINLLDTNEKNFCAFCGKETHFYDEELHKHLCARCFGRIYENKKDKI